MEFFDFWLLIGLVYWFAGTPPTSLEVAGSRELSDGLAGFYFAEVT